MGFKLSRAKGADKPARKRGGDRPAGRRRSGGRIGLMGVGLFAGLLGAVIILGISAYVRHTADREIEASRDREVAMMADNVADRLAAFVNGRGAEMDALTQDPALRHALQSGDAAALREQEARIRQLFPAASGVNLLPPGVEAVELEANPPISYAALDLLRQAETRDTPPPAEVHLFNKPGQHLNLVRRVLDDDGRRIVGHLMLGFPVQTLHQALEGAHLGQGYGEVQQRVNGGQPLVIAEQGREAFRQGAPAVELPVAGSRLKVAYWAPPVDPGAGWNSVLTLGGAGALILILVFYLLLRLYARALQQDQVTLLGALRDAREGRLQNDYELHARESGPLLEGLRALAETGALRGSAGIERMSAAMADSAPTTGGIELEEETPPDLTVLDDSALGAAPLKVSRVNADPSIFRAYDIRGIVGETLSPDVVHELGRAIGSQALAQGESSIVVGRDGRDSSPELAEALIRGLRVTGIDVKDIGQAISPLVYFATHYLDSNSGVVVTGSHNPGEYNGLKVVIAGQTLSGEAIQDLRRRVEQQDYASGRGGLEAVDVAGDYLERIRSDVQLAKPLKVVVDCGNGTAGAFAPSLFESLGCQVIPLYCEVDGSFPNHHPDPSRPENLEALIQAVRDNQADLGLAFDGDGDRLGVVDSAGNIIWPDRLLMLLSMDVLSRTPGGEIIYDVKCSRQLGKIIRDFGGVPEMWKTGHSLIKARMKETGALLAGEMSGHIFFQERWYGFDDALYAGARLLEILANDHRETSGVFAVLPQSVSTPELSVCMEEGRPAAFMEQLQANAGFPDGELYTIDGLRVEFADGWGLVRASNTTPCLVLRFEADDEPALSRIQEQFRNAMLAVEPGLQLPF
ncbi:MAG TPA: phosphomannomutase/phosphoglucomutase [Thiohalobacter sp.]|nr:phosphomannomutase/phosphoglucomutase [Thiohalobacter sp.]